MLITLAENFTLLNVSFQKLKSKAITKATNKFVCPMSYSTSVLGFDRKLFHLMMRCRRISLISCS